MLNEPLTRTDMSRVRRIKDLLTGKYVEVTDVLGQSEVIRIAFKQPRIKQQSTKPDQSLRNVTVYNFSDSDFVDLSLLKEGSDFEHVTCKIDRRHLARIRKDTQLSELRFVPSIHCFKVYVKDIGEQVLGVI